MTEIKAEREVAASPEIVWSIVTDLESSAETISGITAVERLDQGSGFGVGTRWRETRVMFGKEATEEMEVTAVDEGRSYVVEARNGDTTYRSVMSVEPSSGGSLLSMTFGAQSSGMVSKAMAATVGRMFASATRKTIASDLDDIAAAAEARSGTE